MHFVARSICKADRVDLVEKLLNGGYVGINDHVWRRGTLLGITRSIKMAEFLINHGAVFKVGEFDCFSDYIYRLAPHMLNHFFNHPQFIYRDRYMECAIDLSYELTCKAIVGILKRKRDRQRSVITMSALADRYRTNVYVDLLPLVVSFM